MVVGLHIRLMCQQWINGFITVNEAGYPCNLSEKQTLIFDKIKHKYSAEKNGVLINKKLNKIKKDKEVFIQKARKSGMDGALKRWGSLREPYGEPYSENIALQPSSSTSKLSIAGRLKISEIIEYLRITTDQNVTDAQIEHEAKEFEKKYQAAKIKNLKNLCTTWAGNIKVWQKQDKSKDSYM